MSLDMNAVKADPRGFLQWASQLPSAASSGAYSGWANGAIGQAMNEATNQIASAVAQEMVDAVTQTAMKYTGQTSFGQSGVAQSGIYNQRANSMADQMRSAVLGGQRATRSLMPIARPFGRK